jgi:hypothetical protein
MPILGNLSEFPLPEVLLLIGARTGRLRLLDVPEFGILEIDFFNGEVHSLHIGKQTLTEINDLIDKLSAVVQANGGMFEFKMHSVVPVKRHRPLTITQLVMSLVCHVDEQAARQQASPHYWYMLETPQPEIWIEPELEAFFTAARASLTTGVYRDQLAEKLKLDPALVHKNLTNLRLLGLIKMIDGVETVSLSGVNVQEKISRKTNDFIRASRATGEIQRITGKLPKIQKP